MGELRFGSVRPFTISVKVSVPKNWSKKRIVVDMAYKSVGYVEKMPAVGVQLNSSCYTVPSLHITHVALALSHGNPGTVYSGSIPSMAS